MGSITVVVVDELGKDAVQVALVDGDHVVQALLPGGSHPALGDGVGARRPEGRLQALDAQASGALADLRAPNPVTVMDQVSRFSVPRCGFYQLSPNPGGGGMGGDLEVDKLAPPMQ